MLGSKLHVFEKLRDRSLVYWLTLALWTVATYSTTRDASRSLLASADLWIHDRWPSLLQPSHTAIERQRAIQQHYLSYGVYIPIDDIVVDARQQLPESLAVILQAACGKGRAFVWVPLPFHFPVLGEKVFEWCLVKA